MCIRDRYWNTAYLKKKGIQGTSILDNMKTADPIHKQLAWLQRTLSTSDACLKIAVAHNPMYVDGPPSTTVETIRALLEPLFVEYKLAAYLTGHSHTLQYRVKNGIHHVISGGGSMTEPLAPPKTAYWSEQANGFLSVHVNRSGVGLQMTGVGELPLYKNNIPFEDNRCFA
eukprot:TRINITY_DN2944_c0_g2_i1.p1 TRINITY_DN2944_c0_g2~~TRINITY_DN2944_c0_g2_i1.p1  ORF type:complete len:171 (-),score=44.43 TRINITY_DN2944_c0_g2_i1:275-787(-)